MALPDRVHVSKTVADRLAGQFSFVPRGAIDVKGAGLMETFWLEAVARSLLSPGTPQCYFFCRISRAQVVRADLPASA